MSCCSGGRRPLASRSCFGISCFGSRSSQEEAARPPSNQQSAIERNSSSANDPSPIAAPSLPPNVQAGDTPISWGKMKITLVKSALQVAAAGLKAAPIPNLDQLPNILLSLIQTYETVEGNNEKLEELCKSVHDVEEFILQPLRRLGGSIPPEVAGSLGELESDLASQRDRITPLLKQKRGIKVLLATDITGEISATETRLRAAINLFNAAASTANLQEIARRRIDDAFSRLSRSVANAKYMSVAKEQCLPTTRSDIQHTIVGLLDRHDSRFVRLQGSPGTGKTAIAKSIAESLDRDKRLAASFFWDKTGSREGAYSIERFPCTLADQLASFSPEYERLLVNHLLHPSSRGVHMLPLEGQMVSLVIEPMSKISEMFSLTYPVIVLDGLDECGDRETLEKLMQLVLLLNQLPPTFIVLVSSRPESEIRAVWGSSDDVSCLSTDKIREDDTDHTIREMVKAGLATIHPRHPPDWPPEDDLRTFVQTCRQLPVLAVIRVREVKILAKGLTLQEAFEEVKKDGALSKDLNDDYLRILRRAYRGVRPRVLDRYREVVGTVIAAQTPLGVAVISKILGISDERIRAALDPISPILNVPTSDSNPIHFYHATAKEFLIGPPHGDENDREFFFSDVKGVFLALPLLKILNCNLKRNIANTPNLTPFGEGGDTDDGSNLEQYVVYAAKHWQVHLDLSLASEELWVELRLFLTTKLLFWMEFLETRASGLQTLLEQEQYFTRNNADLIRLLHDIGEILPLSLYWDPREIYRSRLPFLPPSSPVRALYSNLSDPIRLLRVGNRIDALHILSNTSQLSNKSTPIPPIACTTLSDDGRRVALGFRDGVIQVVDAELGVSISQFTDSPPSPPVWLVFIDEGRIATENVDGDIYILNYVTSHRQQIGSRLGGAEKVIMSLSHDGSMIVRVSQHLNTPWYGNMHIIRISAKIPIIDALASPSLDPPVPAPTGDKSKRPLLPLQRSLGFSPDGQYVAAFDSRQAFVWSSTSTQVVARYSVVDHSIWFLNTNHPSVMTPIELPDDVVITSIFEPSQPISSLSCVLFSLEQPSGLDSLHGLEPVEIISHVARRTPQLDSFGGIWYRGRKILTIPARYRNPNSVLAELQFQSESDILVVLGGAGSRTDVVLPTSRDGTRFLICDEEGYPVVVDMSEVIRGDFAL